MEILYLSDFSIFSTTTLPLKYTSSKYKVRLKFCLMQPELKHNIINISNVNLFIPHFFLWDVELPPFYRFRLINSSDSMFPIGIGLACVIVNGIILTETIFPFDNEKAGMIP